MQIVSTSFYRENSHLLAFGFLFTFISSFGQTFLVSLYVPAVQSYFNIGDGTYGSIYAAATLLSAFTLIYLGRFIDKIRLTKFAVRVLIGLIIANLLMSQAYHLAFVFIGLFLLRLFGQALSTHTALTSMGRFFEANRGKALSIAVLGHPFGEAILPIIVVSMIGAIGWRLTLISQAGLVALAIPLSLYLLMSKSAFSKLKMFMPSPQSEADKKATKPLAILKHPAFWILAPSNFASGSIGTALIFFQLKIGAERDWSPAAMAASFVAYAIGSAIFTLIAGFLTDRFNARKLYPLYLVPFISGLFLFYFESSFWVYVVLITSIGVTNGFGGVLKNAAIPELFGIRNLGAFRSFFTTAMVFSTALGPVVFGVLLDIGFTFENLALGSIIFMLLVSLNALRIYSLHPFKD